MALASTAANISAQDGSGAVTNFSNGAVIPVNAGALLTFALQSTSGIGQWTLEFECPSYPALHQRKFDWRPGNVNAFQVPMPDYAVGGAQDNNILQGITLYSTVSDSSGGAIPQSIYTFRGTTSQEASILFARGVVTSALQAYTNNAGTLTENGNGALANQDGITWAVGDRLFLPPGIAAAATDVGVYQVVGLGSAGSTWTLTRVGDMPNGALVATGSEIHVTEGTLFAGSQWVLTTTGTVTIGTTTQTWFPRQVTQQLTLVAGTVTVNTIPVLSAAKLGVAITRSTANTSTATTGGYAIIGGITSGNLGTATFAVQAAVAAGTINNADISTLQVTVMNQV